MPNTILPDYPTKVGNKTLVILDHTGPASYATGGETVSAGEWFFSGIDMAKTAPLSMSGTYQVLTLYPAGGTARTTSVKLAWYVVATGLEVGAAVNLSAEHVRVEILGV